MILKKEKKESSIFDLNLYYEDEPIIKYCKSLSKMNYEGLMNRKKDSKKVIIYHHNDLDGYGSAAAIVYHLRCMFVTVPIELYAIDYRKQLDMEINDDNEYWFVDYSFSAEANISYGIKSLANKKNVVWIDHHYSSILSINKYKKLESINGIVISQPLSGALLTWVYCSLCNGSKKRIPRVIKYISDYDTFSHNLKQTTEWYYGISSNDFDIATNFNFWKKCFESNNSIKTMITNGEVIWNYLQVTNKSLCNSYSFETEINGYTILCLNRTGNSLMFGDKFDEYDIVCPFYYNGESWTYSFFTHRDDIDVSEIAKLFGGGGHQKAAGFTSREMVLIH